MPIPVSGTCWQDSDCAGNQYCLGPEVAVWNAYRDDVGKAGRCVPYGLAWTEGACCGAGKPCATGSGVECAFPTEAQLYSGHKYYVMNSGALGRCLGLPAEGHCWNDYDCAPKDGILCEGPSLCPCDDEACTPTPGLCTVAPTD